MPVYAVRNDGADHEESKAKPDKEEPCPSGENPIGHIRLLTGVQGQNPMSGTAESQKAGGF
jgi:hypothetical protein